MVVFQSLKALFGPFFHSPPKWQKRIIITIYTNTTKLYPETTLWIKHSIGSLHQQAKTKKKLWLDYCRFSLLFSCLVKVNRKTNDFVFTTHYRTFGFEIKRWPRPRIRIHLSFPDIYVKNFLQFSCQKIKCMLIPVNVWWVSCLPFISPDEVLCCVGMMHDEVPTISQLDAFLRKSTDKMLL